MRVDVAASWPLCLVEMADEHDRRYRQDFQDRYRSVTHSTRWQCHVPVSDSMVGRHLH